MLKCPWALNVSGLRHHGHMSGGLNVWMRVKCALQSLLKQENTACLLEDWCATKIVHKSWIVLPVINWLMAPQTILPAFKFYNSSFSDAKPRIQRNLILSQWGCSCPSNKSSRVLVQQTFNYSHLKNTTAHLSILCSSLSFHINLMLLFPSCRASSLFFTQSSPSTSLHWHLLQGGPLSLIQFHQFLFCIYTVRYWFAHPIDKYSKWA